MFPDDTDGPTRHTDDADDQTRVPDDEQTRVLSGIDVVSIERVETKLAETDGFTSRVFTDAERAYCEERARPAEHYAARWATKEAFVKAVDLPNPTVPFRSVEVVRESAGPRLSLDDEARELLDRSISRYDDDASVEDLDVSLTHDRALGAALGQVVVLVRASPSRP